MKNDPNSKNVFVYREMTKDSKAPWWQWHEIGES